MSHYVADGANPHHASIHCEGWVGSNPKGYTREGGIHGAFEIGYADAIDLQSADIVARLGPLRHQNGDLFDTILKFLEESAAEVETIFALDQRGALANPDDRAARAFVYRRSAAGAALLRDLLYRAWWESAGPARGEPRPQDPRAPRYDPETGSAPAR